MIDCVITDPPYNVDYSEKTEHLEKNGYGSAQRKIANDNMSDDQFRKFLLKAYKAMHQVMRPGATIYVFHSDVQGHVFRQTMIDAGFKFSQCLIWKKNAFVLGRADYQWIHEPCLYGWKEGAAHYFVDDRTQATVIEDARPDFHKMKKAELQALLEEIYSDRTSTTVLSEDNPLTNDVHPTMKPLKLLARLVKNSTRKDEAVLDPFGGSGSTLITCEQLDRACFTCELDPHYCDVIIERWETFTGNKAVKLTD